jgi:hypothetical protein
MTPLNLVVFGKICTKVTSDEEIDNLGHDVDAVRNLNYDIYVSQETDYIIEIIYTPTNGYSVIIDNMVSEDFTSLAEAEENFREKIFNKFEYFKKMMAVVA